MTVVSRTEEREVAEWVERIPPRSKEVYNGSIPWDKTVGLGLGRILRKGCPRSYKRAHGRQTLTNEKTKGSGGSGTYKSCP